MPITRKVEASYYASDGSRYATVHEAQVAELVQLLNKTDGSAYISTNITGSAASAVEILAKGILEEADAYLAILTTGPRSRPKARRVAGTTSPKRAARKTNDPDAPWNRLKRSAEEAKTRREAAEANPDKATAEQVSNGIAAMLEAVDNQPVEAA